MATVAQVATASLQSILVQAAEAPLEASEYEDFIFAMNNYMLALDAQGVTLGYTEVSSLSDDVTIPTGALRGLIANMGIESAPYYGGVISDGLVLAAKAGLDTMRLIGQSIPTSALPGTLPIGTGNEGDYAWWISHFYPSEEAAILAETTGSIGLETNTNETAGD